MLRFYKNLLKSIVVESLEALAPKMTEAPKQTQTTTQCCSCSKESGDQYSILCTNTWKKETHQRSSGTRPETKQQSGRRTCFHFSHFDMKSVGLAGGTSGWCAHLAPSTRSRQKSSFPALSPANPLPSSSFSAVFNILPLLFYPR